MLCTICLAIALWKCMQEHCTKLLYSVITPFLITQLPHYSIWVETVFDQLIWETFTHHSILVRAVNKETSFRKWWKLCPEREQNQLFSWQSLQSIDQSFSQSKQAGQQIPPRQYKWQRVSKIKILMMSDEMWKNCMQKIFITELCRDFERKMVHAYQR